jgi:SAM-dependent methyltransferase/aminoglycoside phosphotransferase (APT) family kinase protein
MPTAPADLRCPKCVGELQGGEQRAKCTKCGSEFPVTDGIFDLRCGRHDYYFNPVPPPEMQRLIQGMTRESWPQTIRTFVSHTRAGAAGWLDNLIVDGRYAWKLLLDLHKDAVLLDLGCGLGNLTHNLAPFVRKTYALDLTYLRLAFSRKRFSIFNAADDITVLAGGDGPHLPFRDHALDCVVLSGVLEWVGEGDTAPFHQGTKPGRVLRMITYGFGERSPRQVQLRFLKDIRRVLKPGGQLFVAIENRLGYEYFTGRPDHHSNLKYGSLLPRFAANLYSIAVNHVPYRTYTYSIPGHRRLFAEAGFPNVEFLGFSRGYSQLEEIMPAEIDMQRWQPAPVRGFKERVRRNKYFVPAFGVIGSSTPRPWRRLIDGLLVQIERDLAQAGHPGALAMERFTISDKDKLVIKGSQSGKDLVIRIPLRPAALAAERQNARMLALLGAMSPRDIPCPRALASGEFPPLSYFVEEFLPGEPLMQWLQGAAQHRMEEQVATLLDSMNRVGPGVRVLPLEGALYEREVTTRLARVCELVDDPQAQARASEYFHSRLHGTQAAVGLFHGDFSARNILAENGRVTGLIDWEGGAEAGLPILDTINYLVTVHMLRRPEDRLDRIIPLLASGAQEPGDAQFLATRYAALGMDISRQDGWVYLAWLHAVSMLMAGNLPFNPGAIQRNVATVLDAMLGKAP